MSRSSMRMVALAALYAGGCAGAAEQRAPGAETAVEADVAVPSPPEPWQRMGDRERKHWMNDAVVPHMEPLWKDYDAERFAQFGCETCHGPDMVEREFAMPNPHILALHPTGSPEQKQMVKDHPEMVRFMFNDVLPTMRTLLGAPEYDETTKQGFSCYACHPAAEDAEGTQVSAAD